MRREKLGNAILGVADHERMNAHGIQRLRHIEQCFAFFGRTAVDQDVDHVDAELLGGNLKRRSRAGGGLEK